MDVNVLLCLIEQLCAKLLITEKKLYHQGDYHNLHLPKSWVLQYFTKVRSYASRFDDKQPFIQVLVNLMSCLYNGQIGTLKGCCFSPM